ncbi:MAG: sterol desaturase family protein, partial [Myxococcota bacterium]
MDFEVAKKVVTAIIVGFAVIELVAGRFLHRERTTVKDIVMEVVCTVGIPLVLVPTVLTLAPFLAEALVPDSEGWLATWPMWAMFGLLFVGDDLTQYWWHRMSHTPWMYPLHRAHHSASYMSVRLVYRNNLVYYLFMPGIWVSAVLVYWGFGAAYSVYIIAKLTVIIGAHSSVPWDVPLYRWRWTRPLMWVVERVIST